MFFSALLGIMAVLAAIWVTYDAKAHNKKLSDGTKVWWIIIAVLFSIITAMVY
jgi:hypothetical protein